MQTEDLISINEFCKNRSVEMSFINSLQQTGLIEITKVEETEFIDAVQLRELEKIVSFHYELDINLEGIETINHLLNKIESLHNEIISLKNRLHFYESDYI